MDRNEVAKCLFGTFRAAGIPSQKEVPCLVDLLRGHAMIQG